MLVYLLKNEIERIDNLSLSYSNICESIFIEIKNVSKTILSLGVYIYRHHTAVSDLKNTFLDNTLEKIMKSKKYVPYSATSILTLLNLVTIMVLIHFTIRSQSMASVPSSFNQRV